jgi:hypothetical protein
MSESTGSAAPAVEDWKRLLAFGLGGFAATAAIWFALRAYTGVYDVLNLRVFIGAFVLVPVLSPILVAKTKSLAVSALTSVLAVSAILAAEALAASVTGKPIRWEKFNLIFLGVAAVLPFSKEYLTKNK